MFMCAPCPWEHPTYPSQGREETIIISADFEGEMWAVFTGIIRSVTRFDLAVPICHARAQKCSQCCHTWLAGALRACEQAAAPQFTGYTFKCPQIYFGFADVNEIHIWEKEPTETIRNINVNTGVLLVPACWEAGKETLWGLLHYQQLSCEILFLVFLLRRLGKKRLQDWSLGTVWVFKSCGCFSHCLLQTSISQTRAKGSPCPSLSGDLPFLAQRTHVPYACKIPMCICHLRELK